MLVTAELKLQVGPVAKQLAVIDGHDVVFTHDPKSANGLADTRVATTSVWDVTHYANGTTVVRRLHDFTAP